MMTIFSSAGCPFAQRTRALLALLEQPFEHREVDLQNRDPELLVLSPTGKVPFLVDDEFRLFESGVINDYLAEKLGFETAYPDDIELRALHRLAMRRWDDVIVPAFYRSLKRPEILDDELRVALSRELEFLSTVVSRTDGEVANLMGLHLATHWTRMDWLRELTPLTVLLILGLGWIWLPWHWFAGVVAVFGAIVVGTGKIDQLKLPFVVNNADIQVGDLLVTSGLGGAFPSGYPVAIVESVTRIPQEPYADVTARPSASLGQVREVLLIFSAPDPDVDVETTSDD